VEKGPGGEVQVPPTESYFLRVWHMHMPKLKCRKYHSFMMCDDCVSLNDKLRLAKDYKEKQKIWEKKRVHLFMVKEERFDYAQRIMLAKRRPDLYLHLTIDGSDNSNYGFPFMSERTHGSSKGYKVRSKLYAAILHGHFASVFTYATNLTGGSNVTIEIIHRMLEMYLNDHPGNKLPPTLWVQLDNTCKDNKNRYVFAYAHMLVDCGLFQQVQIHFLPVGHTHCDIDQLFSRISVHLYGNNCWDFKDLLRKARAACKMVKYVRRLYGFANFKNHLLHHKLVIAGNQFKNFTQYRLFRFTRVDWLNEAGVVEGFGTQFQARRSIFHKSWHDLDLNVDGHIRLVNKPLSYENVFSVDLSSLDYIAPRVRNNPDSKDDKIALMTLGVESCSSRIITILGHERGNEVINGLRAEIELQSEDQLVQFNWNLEMYRNPPINWNPSVPFVSRSAADLSSVRDEAVAVVNMEDNGGKINEDMALANIGDYVIVASNLPSDSLKRPFWVGQITQNYTSRQKLRVHWLLPPTTHSSRGGRGTKGTEGSGDGKAVPPPVEVRYVTPANVPKARRGKVQEPNRLCTLKNYPYASFQPALDCNTSEKSHSNKGTRKTVLPTHSIDYACVYFSFPHLGEEDRLPNNVLDAISAENQIQWKG